MKSEWEYAYEYVTELMRQSKIPEKVGYDFRDKLIRAPEFSAAEDKVIEEVVQINPGKYIAWRTKRRLLGE